MLRATTVITMEETPNTPPPAPAPIADTTTGLTPSVAAGLACLFGPLSGILFLVIEKKNQFVRFWAMQSTIFGGVMIVGSVVITIFCTVIQVIPTLGQIIGLIVLIALMFVWLAAMCVWVVMLFKAFTGVEWKMPYISKIADQQLARLPVAG